MAEELKADKSTQDVIIPVVPPVETQTLLVRVERARSQVLVYGKDTSEDPSGRGQVVTLRSNSNLSVLKTAENHLTRALENGQPLLIPSPAGLSRLRQLTVRALTLRAAQDSTPPDPPNVAKWHLNQMQLWLLDEKPHQEEQEILDKVNERVRGARDYLSDISSLRADRGKLKIYLSTLEELCLILEREQDRPKQFSWGAERCSLFDAKTLNQLIERGLEGAIDGVNEQNKALRLLVLLVSDSSPEVVPVEAVRRALNLGGPRLQISLSQSLRFIRLLSLIWWNRQLRLEVGRSLKKHVSSRQVFKPAKAQLDKRAKIPRDPPQEHFAPNPDKHHFKRAWKQLELDCDSETFHKVSIPQINSRLCSLFVWNACDQATIGSSTPSGPSFS